MLHIDLPSHDDILALAGTRTPAAVTIYVATTPVTQSAQADRTELGNLAREAVAQLRAAGVDSRDADAIAAALDDIGDDDGFWAMQANSLAIFATPGRVRTFRLPSRLESSVHVADRFHIKPILRSVSFGNEAWVLAISMGSVRLVEVSAELPPHEVKVPGVPAGMADALGRRSHGERTGAGRSGEQTSESALLRRYARAVDEALRPVLTGHVRPLIVAAAEPLASVYRAVSSYPHTASEVIGGSADDTPVHVLADEARPVLDRIHDGEVRDFAALFAQRGSEGRATADIAQAARAATFGAIDSMIVDIDITVPGTVDDETGAVTLAEHDDGTTYGVVDEIVSRALKAGARIIAARAGEVPGGGALAAILRYPV